MAGMVKGILWMSMTALIILVSATIGSSTSEHCSNNKDCHYGNCTLAGSCRCPLGYTGRQCHIPICHHACQNGGQCVSPGKCVCSSNYTGQYCESCASGAKSFCPADATCVRYEIIPGRCCPQCILRKWEKNCSPGPCRPVPGCRQYQYANESDCCPQCIDFDPNCLDETCKEPIGCEEYATRVPRGRCCPRCVRFRCTSSRCPVVDGCIRYDNPWQGLCCPQCVAYRSSCAGVKCPATPNCAQYVQHPGKCCATCKRLGILRNRQAAHSPCASVICPEGKICHAEGRQPFCRCRFSCPKKKRQVCGSDGVVYRNRCRLQRMACLQAVLVKPVHMIFCTFYAAKIRSHLSRVKALDLRGGIFLSNNRPVG